MKRLIQTGAFVGLLLVLMVSAQAQVSKTYFVKIPFDFNIGQESYKAGTYQVNVLENMLLIRNKKSTSSKVLTTLSAEEGKGFETPQFYFNRVENKNVLVEIAGKNFNIKLGDTSATARDVTGRKKLTAENNVSDHDLSVAAK
jgi:hypothetical protein